jgi:tRNA dimethylallyltransferase
MPGIPFVIAGPTAVGKTSIAAEVAARCNAEIVSADAFQVYAGLDVLTAKPVPEILAKVPHHMVGVIPLAENFDAVRYAEMARNAIADVESRGKLPILVGGTGFYIRALTGQLPDLPAADPDLRSRLEGEPVDSLILRLSRLDPVAAARIDGRNPRRLVRAIEVCTLTGKPFSSFHTDPGTTHGVTFIRDRAELHARIEERTRTMFEQGVAGEVSRVRVQVGSTAAQAIGYREICAHLDSEMDCETCIARIQQRTRQYAKRQLTWFRRQTRLAEVNLTTISQREPFIDSLVSRVLGYAVF